MERLDRLSLGQWVLVLLPLCFVAPLIMAVLLGLTAGLLGVDDATYVWMADLFYRPVYIVRIVFVFVLLSWIVERVRWRRSRQRAAPSPPPEV